MKKSLSYILIFLCFLGLISCSKDKPKWDETKNGVKIYHQFDNKLLGIPSIEWIGDTTYFGLAHGKGKFIYKDKNYPENNVTKNVYAHYGSIEEIEDLDNYIVGPQNEKGALEGFGVRVFRGRTTIGKASDGKFKGEGIILIKDTLFYKGKLKDSEPDGKGISYYPNGIVKYDGEWKKGYYNGEGKAFLPDGNLYYEGKWKNDKFNGLGTLYQDGKPIQHVWHNGELDKVTLEYYNKIKENKNHFSAAYLTKLESRGLSWERYHAWYYIAIWFSLVVIILIILSLLIDIKDLDPYMKLKPWKPWIPYTLWIIFGAIGGHRVYLKSNGVFIYLLAFSTAVCIETRDICHYLFWPSTWFMWNVSVITMCAVGVIGLMLLFDIVWIPWRCYILNFNYFRKDRFETPIIKQKSIPVLVQTYEKLPAIVNQAATEFPIDLQTAESIQKTSYSGNTGFWARTGRVLKGDNSGVEFEVNKLKKIEDVRKRAVTLYNELAKISKDLNLYLLQSRAAAYRNLYLAKELIAKIKYTKSQEQKLQTDLKLDDKQIQELENLSNYIDTNVSMDWSNTANMAIDNVDVLMNSGLKTGWAIGIGVATSILSNAMDALQREQRAREAAVNASAEVVDHLDKLTREITKNQAKILRSGEILKALYNANKAFVLAYVPLRDELYGLSPSLKGFIRDGKPTKEILDNKEFIQNVWHLAQVCSEYNKINKAK